MKQYINDERSAIQLIETEMNDDKKQKNVLQFYLHTIRKEEDFKRRHQKKHIYFWTETELVGSKYKSLKEQKTVLREVYSNEFKKELRIAINSLTRKEQQVINLIFFQGFSTVCIAEKFGVSQQAISKTKKRALNKMSCNAKLRELYLDEN